MSPEAGTPYDVLAALPMTGTPSGDPPVPPPDGVPARRTHGRRADVLALLRASAEPVSIAAVAHALDLHPNTARFHLAALVRAGQVEEVEMAPVGPGRPPSMFRAHGGMDPAGPRSYRLLAGILVDGLAAEPDPTGRAAAAGRAWGGRLAAQRPGHHHDRPGTLRWLVRTLDEAGFAPRLRSGGDPDSGGQRRGIDRLDSGVGGELIELRHCPFLDLVDSRADVVCAVHLGLMQGATADTSVTIDRLQPYATPDRCVAYLGSAEG